jgi:hypothetical protein
VAAAEASPALRMAAMMSIGALRLAIDSWTRDQGKRPVSIYLKKVFADLKSEL